MKKMERGEWIHKGFEAFSEGSFENGGDNLYVNANGVIEMIHRFDINNDGYVDIILTHRCQTLKVKLGRLRRQLFLSITRKIHIITSMEFVSGIKLRDIFLDNGNWWRFFLKHPQLIRMSIIINVLKMLVCRTGFLGYHFFICPKCKKSIKAPHTCKSRFCSSCGKKATDDWIKTSFNTLPDTIWQHITFTIPRIFSDFFWVNRYLFGKIPSLAAGIIQHLAKQKGFLPGIYLAIHTFGRDIKRNVHLHLSTTAGGLSPSLDTWIGKAYFHHDNLKQMWRYEIISLFRKEYKSGHLKLPPSLKHIKTYTAFNSWLSHLYQKTWVVHLNQQSDNRKANVEYLGKYLKRPPIGETRIKAYNHSTVTFEYLDHYTETTAMMTLPVLEFIARLIAHIPDLNFRNIRYYGFLSNRLRGKLLPVVYKLLKMKNVFRKKVYTPWRQMILNTFGYEPLKCRFCGTLMQLSHIIFPSKTALTARHQEIANGYFMLL